MKFLISSILLTFLFVACGQKSPIFSTDEGAIKGFDPVAYFNQNQPVKGQKEIAFLWKGATWHFVSQENKEIFANDPEKYAPQYGGYCAYGVTKGGLYKIEPEAWAIINDKLYLNYSKSIQAKWEKDIPGFIESADRKWPNVIAEN